MTKKLLGAAPSGTTDAATKAYVDTSTTPGNSGLTGGAGANLSVVAGAGIQISSGVALASGVAGAGLTLTAGVIDVAAGNGISTAGDVVSLASSTGGAGLTYTSGVLAVGANTGITVNADDIAVDYGPDPWKKQVRVATTANGTLSTAYANGQTVDGVTLATGDRILLKNQTTGSENGIYTVNASGAPTRATDFDATGEAANGCVVEVLSGTINAQSFWNMSNTSGPTIGTTALTFSLLATAGDYALNSYSADRTADSTDGTIEIDATGASRTVTLPTAVGRKGQTYLIKRTDSTTANTVTVATTSSQTIDGATTYTRLWDQYTYVQVQSDGANWVVIGQSTIPEPWQTPSYNTNWLTATTFNGLTGLQGLRYRRDVEGNVWVEGAFKAGGTLPGAAVFGLAASYRPPQGQMVPCLRNNGGTVVSGMVLINNAGNFDLFSNSAMAVAINNEYYVNGKFSLS